MNKNEKNPSLYDPNFEWKRSWKDRFFIALIKFTGNDRNIAIIDSVMASTFIVNTIVYIYTLAVKTPVGIGNFIIYLIGFFLCAYYSVKYTRDAYKSIKKYRLAKRMARAAVML